MAGELNFNLLDQNMPAKIAGSVTGAYQAGQDRDRATQQFEQSNLLAKAQLEHAQSQNELSKYTLNTAKRTDEQQMALDTMMKQGFDPKNAEHRMKLRGMGAPGMAMEKWLVEQESKDIENAGKKIKTAKETQDFFNQGKRDLSENPSDANVTAWTEDAVLKGFMSQAQADESLKHMLGMPPDVRKSYLAKSGSTAGDLKVPPTDLAKAEAELAALPAGDPRRAAYVDYIKKLTTHAPRAVTSVTLNTAQEKEFEKELGTGQAKALLASKVGAEDARAMLDTIKTGRQILNSGMITGSGANFFIALDQGLKKAGIDFGGDASANSQAYVANMAQNVGKLIKQFGAGTGLSDADRAYAEKMAGGSVAMDEKAIRKILDINERAANNTIKLHNKKSAGIKTNIPLTVEVDPETPAPAAPAGGGALSPAEQKELEALRSRFKK
jgi:hypothetical protein